MGGPSTPQAQPTRRADPSAIAALLINRLGDVLFAMHAFACEKQVLSG
jgi:hypothetical protein